MNGPIQSWVALYSNVRVSPQENGASTQLTFLTPIISASIDAVPNSRIRIVTVTTTYRGASADVMESQVTKPLEDSLSGIEGVEKLTGAPVMALGGFNGTDPAPTLAQFQDDVAAGRIHYFVDATMMGPHGDNSGSDDAARIADWVTLNFSSRTVDSTTVYDLSE